MALLYAGQVPRWDLTRLRPKGARLKTFGGRASGPDPLHALFQFCVEVFKKAAGRKLNSVECHDIVCKIADSVIVGGVRRCCSHKYNVLMADGSWKQISTLTPGEQIKIEDSVVTILNVFDNGEQETMKIKMEDGTEHVCTPEHRWYVYNHNTNECEWVETQNLSSGNYSMLEPKDIWT